MRLIVMMNLLAITMFVLAGCATTTKSHVVEIQKWSLASTPLERNAAQLGNSVAEHLTWAKTLYNQIVSESTPRTINGTLVPYTELMMHLDAARSECNLFSRVHPDEAVRTGGEQGEQEVSAYATELSLDRRLFEALRAVDVSGEDKATRYMMEKELRDFRRAGVDEDDATRERIRTLNEEIVKLGQEFARNIAADVREITLNSPADLDGLPQDWIDKHPLGLDGKIHVNTQYPDYGPFMTYARNPDARRALYREFKNRAYPTNMNVLEQILNKRHELSNLLGYEHWADYETETKMVGTADNARAFLERIHKSGRSAAQREYDVLLQRKRRDTPGATRVAGWERAYYDNLVKAEDYAFDAQAVRPYLNYPEVRKGIFDVTAKLFGIRYEQVQGLHLWHDAVTAWDVFDGKRRLGRFYLDMHPRDNKYSHAAQFDYRAGIKGRRLPQAVLVCNFPDPNKSDDGVALMEHDDVVTFFHEFGHLLHTIFAGHRQWMANTGISTEWDFVEAPSQMLEEWCYNVETLQSFAKHYETGERIPEALVRNLKRAAEFGKGIQNAHQVFYSSVSLSYYDRDPSGMDTTKFLIGLQDEYSPFDHEEGTHFQCSFGHLFNYSAIYYTYRWSLVIAKSMFSKFERDGLLNTRTARRYRQKVLAPGGSKPAADLIKDFLGHPYKFDAFENWLNRS